jgi:hypothetical protein
VPSRECRVIAEFSSRPPAWSRRLPSALVGVASAASALAFSGSAQALPLLTLSGSVRGLYGSSLEDSEPVSLNPYGPGLGLRAGVTLPASLYLGASLDFFLGESDTIGGVKLSSSLLQVLANVGYDAGLGPLTLRPSLGLGLAESSTEAGSIDSSEGDFVLSPGAELIIGLGLLSVSGEVRYNKIFADGAVDGLILGLGLGFSI